MSEQPPFGHLRDAELVSRIREHVTSGSELDLLVSELDRRYRILVGGVVKLGEDAGMLLFSAGERSAFRRVRPLDPPAGDDA